MTFYSFLIVNFGHNSLLFLCPVVDFEQVNVYWIPHYQFINAEITYYYNYRHMNKNISEIISKDS